MPITKYGVANESQGQLLAGIGASSPTLILKSGQGGLFPPSLECPFFIKLEKYDTALNNFRVLKREIAICTNRSGDTLTITRSAGYCPANYSATTQTNTAFSFDADDTVTQILVGEQIEEIQAAVEGKVDSEAGLRTGFWVNKRVYINPATGNESITNTSSGTSLLDTEEIGGINPATGNENRVPFGNIKNQLSSAGKFTQSVVLWEDIAGSTPTAVSAIQGKAAATVPTLTSDSGNAAFIASMTLFSGSAFQAFDNNTGTSVSSLSTGSTYILRLDMTTAALLAYGMTVSGSLTSGADLIMKHTGSGGAFSLQWSNDGTSWTTIQAFTGNDGAGNPVPSYVPAQTVAWLKYRITGVIPSGSVTVYKWNFRYLQTTAQPIVYTNTMGGNIAGARVKTGIRFSVPYDTTLGIVKTSQVSTSVNARVQLFADDGTTLIAEQTPSSSDTVTFPNTPIAANTVYRLVMNDSTYFGANNNELALATYQTGFQFAVSGTLNGSNDVLPQNIKEVQLGTVKAMKSIANSTIEYSVFSWFVVWPKKKWDLVSLDSNDGSIVNWLSWLVTDRTYYVGNTAGVPSLTPGTIKYPIWNAVSNTQILISKRQSDTIVNLGNVATFNHFGGTVYVNFLFANMSTAQSVTFVGRSSITIYGSFVSGATAWWGYTATLELPPGIYSVLYTGTSSTSITIAH